MLELSDIILLIVMLFFSGFFSASEVALLSLSRLQLKHLIEKKRRGAISVKKLKDDPQRMLTTILIGNNVANVGAASVATAMALEIFQDKGVAIATGVMTFLLLVFGEIMPKYITTRFNTRMALFFGPLIWMLSILLYPLVKMFNLLLTGFDKLLGVKGENQSITEEELKSIVQLGKEEGAIKEFEKTMIQRIFEFDEITASEVMTHKADMEIVNANCTVDDLMKQKSIKHFSRIPLYKKTRDNIVGVLHIKDVLDNLKNKKTKVKIEKLAKKPMYIPENKKIDALLKTFQRKKEHMAIVVDEHGAITGLITIEDVLEEIVGEIMDETDKVDPTIKKLSAKSWMVKGKCEIEELNEKLKMNIKDTDADTLNGYLQEKTGRIPKEGDTITHRRFTITVSKMEGHRVDETKISK